jgi:hypothetical protein
MSEMRALTLLGLLIVSPAWAQVPPDCYQIVQELKAKPPGNGEKRSVELLWNIFVQGCEAKMGGPGAMFDAADMLAIDKVLYSKLK